LGKLIFKLDYPEYISAWQVNLGREAQLNSFLEARISPQAVFIPEKSRWVPKFNCSIEIHDPLLVARQD